MHFLIFVTIVVPLLAQENIKSKIEIDKERDLLRTNKVKEIIIKGNQGLQDKTKIDINGIKVETKGFYNNERVNVVNLKYDQKLNLIEEIITDMNPRMELVLSFIMMKLVM
ncbi:MAG: hypothetical protein IPM96_17590 [Ignavibacteria bacterium]|nr:hypothetical protein [Ignavibacteria bacterium]